ncbi:MAG: hypothetical protein V4480_05005 [Patescibacteria group bacterium]
MELGLLGICFIAALLLAGIGIFWRAAATRGVNLDRFAGIFATCVVVVVISTQI